MDRDEMIRRLCEAFPREAIKQRQGGRGKMLSYLDGATVIRRLNYATENTWDFRVLNEERMGNLLSAYVELTIPGLGSRQHKGVQRIEANAGEDIEKGAITDALKKAATLFGVGLETYADEHEAAAPVPTPRQPRQDAPEPLTDAQERVIAQSWDMAQAGDQYPAVIALLKTLQVAATPDQWTAIKRALAAIKAAHYQQENQQ